MTHICLTRLTRADLSSFCLGPSLWVGLLQRSVPSKLCHRLFRRLATSTTAPTRTPLCNRSTIFVEAQFLVPINNFLREKAELPRAVVAAVNELADYTLAHVAATLCMTKCVTPTEEEWASEVTMPTLIFPPSHFRATISRVPKNIATLSKEEGQELRTKTRSAVPSRALGDVDRLVETGGASLAKRLAWGASDY